MNIQSMTLFLNNQMQFKNRLMLKIRNELTMNLVLRNIFEKLLRLLIEDLEAKNRKRENKAKWKMIKLNQ